MENISKFVKITDDCTINVAMISYVVKNDGHAIVALVDGTTFDLEGVSYEDVLSMITN